MADISLDDYLRKIPIAGSMKNRLGPKISQGQQRKKFAPRITPPGVRNNPQERVSRITPPGVRNNAQERISRITPPGVRNNAQERISRITPQSANNTQDLRGKIKFSKSKLKDARLLIKSRKQNRGQTQGQGQQQRPFQNAAKGPFVSPPHVTVTGIGRVINRQGGNDQQVFVADGGGLMARGGTIQRTIPSDSPQNTVQHVQKPPAVQRNIPIKKTIQNPDYAPMPISRVGNNIVITPENSFRSMPAPAIQQVHIEPVHNVQADYTGYATHPYQEPAAPQYQQQPQYNQQLPDMPMIRIQNDAYRLPDPVHVARPAPPPPPPTQQQQHTYQPSYYEEPEAAVIEPPLRTHLVTERVERVERVPTRTTSASRSMIQSRLGEDPQQTSSLTTDASPLQGYRVLITNLNHVVSQDDIVELFGAVGAMKKVRLIRLGTAEVVFVKREEALAAIRKYNNRELDGQPMHVVLTSGTSGSSPQSSRPSNQSTPEHSRIQIPSRSGVSGDSCPADVDIGLLHKALFKTSSKEDPPVRPVTFTVKI